MMAIRTEDLPKRSFDHNSSHSHSVSPFAIDRTSLWNSKKQQISQSLSENVMSSLESPPQLYYDVKQLGLQLPDQESSTAQSVGQSHHKVGAVGGPNTQDQCISSESGQDENGSKSVDCQLKPVVLYGNPEFMYPPQVDQSHSMGHVPYPYLDPFFGGLFGAHVPHPINQAQMGSHMFGIAPTRIPLPLGLAEDGPIYVNAKQYHGILRRRQSRAKLEAQNKLIKNRKPYLHESRHLHALNRVRGSGGRFLSTKKNRCGSTSYDPSNFVRKEEDIMEFNARDSQTSESTMLNSNRSDITSISNSGSLYRQSPRMSGIMQFNGRLTYGAQYRASLVQ